jgi:hypothetical protein
MSIVVWEGTLAIRGKGFLTCLTGTPLDIPSARRSCVWSEPSVIDAAAYEFAETAKFLDTGECTHRGAEAWSWETKG